MTPKQWMGALDASWPADGTGARIKRLLTWAPGMNNIVPPNHLTIATAQRVAQTLQPDPALTWDQLREAIAQAARWVMGGGAALERGGRSEDDIKFAVFEERVQAGANLETIVSIAKRYWSPALVRRIREKYDARALRREEAEYTQRQMDQQMAAMEAARRKAAKSMEMERVPPSQRVLPPEEKAKVRDVTLNAAQKAAIYGQSTPRILAR